MCIQFFNSCFFARLFIRDDLSATINVISIHWTEHRYRNNNRNNGRKNTYHKKVLLVRWNWQNWQTYTNASNSRKRVRMKRNIGPFRILSRWTLFSLKNSDRRRHSEKWHKRTISAWTISINSPSERLMFYALIRQQTLTILPEAYL